MKIICMEPLGVSQEKIASLAAPLEAAGHEFTYYTTKETDQAKLLARVKDADILMLANQPLSAAIIEQCPNLKMLDIAFTGVDHVGLEAARARGIVACNAAGYSTNAVAELTFGLAISAIRNIVAVDERCRKGGSKDGLVGFELFGKTLGVVGTGGVDTQIAFIPSHRRHGVVVEPCQVAHVEQGSYLYLVDETGEDAGSCTREELKHAAELL